MQKAYVVLQEQADGRACGIDQRHNLWTCECNCVDGGIRGHRASGDGSRGVFAGEPSPPPPPSPSTPPPAVDGTEKTRQRRSEADFEIVFRRHRRRHHISTPPRTPDCGRVVCTADVCPDGTARQVGYDCRLRLLCEAFRKRVSGLQ